MANGRKLRALRVPMMLLALMFAGGAHAATVSVLAGTLGEGDTNVGYPLNISLFKQTSMRYQQVYAGDYFAALNGVYDITAIRFRTDGPVGEAFDRTLGNVRIDLSTTGAGVNGLDMVFDRNPGRDRQTVFSGPLRISSSHALGEGGARAFDVVVSLTTPFRYTVGHGNLLLDIFNFDGGLASQLDATTSRSDGMSRVFGRIESSGTRQDSVGIVTRFDLTPIATPLPAPAALLAVPLTALLALGRRRAKPRREALP